MNRRALLFAIAFLSLVAPASLMEGAWRGEEVKKGGRKVAGALRRARALAARSGRTHFVVFSSYPEAGWMEIRRDADRDGRYRSGVDPLVDGGRVELGEGLYCDSSPAWAALGAAGSLCLDPAAGAGFPGSCHDSFCRFGPPAPLGHVIIRAYGGDRAYCLSFDMPSGRPRLAFLLIETP